MRARVHRHIDGEVVRQDPWLSHVNKRCSRSILRSKAYQVTEASQSSSENPWTTVQGGQTIVEMSHRWSSHIVGRRKLAMVYKFRVPDVVWEAVVDIEDSETCLRLS